MEQLGRLRGKAGRELDEGRYRLSLVAMAPLSAPDLVARPPWGTWTPATGQTLGGTPEVWHRYCSIL